MKPKNDILAKIVAQSQAISEMNFQKQEKNKFERKYQNLNLMDDDQFSKLKESPLEKFGIGFTTMIYAKAKELLDNSNITFADSYRDGGSLLFRTDSNIEIIFPVANFNPSNPVYSPLVLYREIF